VVGGWRRHGLPVEGGTLRTPLSCSTVRPIPCLPRSRYLPMQQSSTARLPASPPTVLLSARGLLEHHQNGGSSAVGAEKLGEDVRFLVGEAPPSSCPGRATSFSVAVQKLGFTIAATG
jgi:hypothetical protein